MQRGLSPPSPRLYWRGERGSMRTTLRRGLAFFLSLTLCLAVLSYADTKPLPELITNSTKDAFEGFRLATSRALAAAYLLTEGSLSPLERLVEETRRNGGFTAELSQALAEARAGEVVDVCIAEQGPPEPVAGVNLAAASEAELDRLTLTGNTSELRRAAARELIRRLLNPIVAGTQYPADQIKPSKQPENIAHPFDSLYELRVFDKRHEDFVFDELKVDMIDLTFGAKADPRKPELIEEGGRVLAQVYYAEYLVTLDPAFVRANTGCEAESEG